MNMLFTPKKIGNVEIKNRKKTIVEIKKANPEYGIRRISDVLKRFFPIKTSPKTIGKTVDDAGSAKKPRSKRDGLMFGDMPHYG